MGHFVFKFSSVSSTETKHFQAPFGVSIFGSIQIENNQNEKPSTKEFTAWLLLKLHVIRQLKCRLKMIIQTECFPESSCKNFKTAMLTEKHLASFWAYHFGGL